MHWSRFGLLALFVSGVAVALQAPAQGPQVDAEFARPADLRDESPKAEEIDHSIADLELLAAGGGDAGCKQVGGFTDFFDGTPRYRGNAYRINKTIRVTAIGMELGLSESVPLHVSVHQRQPNGSWVRYPTPESPDWVIEEPPADGLTSTRFYFTAEIDPPLILESGDTFHDYAIGFAWQGAVSRWGNDLVQYPQGTPASFDFGSILGRVGVNSAPPVANTFPLLTVSGAGAYSMALCVTGACCLPFGSCADLTQAECLGFGADAEFTASGITCADLTAAGDSCSQLPRGACCFSRESCLELNRYTCDSLDGDWAELTFCYDPVDEPCEPRGGCCIDTQCEDNHTLRSCEDSTGIYRGDNVPCTAFPPCTGGACCSGEDCVIELTEANCEGEFEGPGTSCAGNPCIPRGACCNAATGVCTDSVPQPDCESSGRSFRGEGTVCSLLSPTCGKGACCVSGVGCQDANGTGFSRTFCEQTVAGTFRGDGTTCATIDPRCPGTCCWSSNTTCTNNVEPELCQSKLDGTFLPYNQTCANNPCSGVLKSGCCLPSGACVDVSNNLVCLSQLRGQPQLSPCASAVCVPVVPRGACCDRRNLVCTDGVAQADCDTFGLSWSQGLACADLPNPCEPRGACCDRLNLSCQDNVLAADCAGEWTERTFCSQLPVVCAPEGACCAGTVCSTKTEAQCVLDGGNYKGDDVLCDAETCAPEGACCVATNCSLVTQNGCSTLGGVYQGNDTLCDDDICAPKEACCSEAGCANLSLNQCAAADGTPQGPGSVCNDLTCAPRGACCLQTNCIVTTEVQCLANEGAYRQDGSTCGDNACTPTGACCDGPVCSVTIGGDCPGTYLGDGELCTPADRCVPRGACCDGATCTLTTQAACTGTYTGDKTECGPDVCAIGACCDDLCSCADDVPGFECIAAGGQFHPGTDCATIGPCAQRIVDSAIPNCAIDAGQPHPPLMPPPVSGITAMKIVMSCDAANLTPAAFEVVGAPDPATLTVVTVTPNGTTLDVALSGQIPLNQYTCVRHVPSDTRACVGYLPGDVDNSATTNPDDVLALAAGLQDDSLTVLQCDMDRSGRCGPLDLLRNIDLQHGSGYAGVFWGGASIGAPCPSAP